MGAGYRVVLAGALALLLFVTFGTGWMAAVTLGNAPEQNAQPAAQQQANPAQQPAPTKKKPATSGGKQPGCPGTRVPQFRCDALTAEATMRQADIAADQTTLLRWNNWLGLLTVLVAGLAVRFAWGAVRAADDANRAWLDVRTESVLIAPGKGNRIGVAVKLVATNKGRGAAAFVRLHVMFVPIAHGNGHAWSQIIKPMEKVLKRLSKHDVGRSVFPGDKTRDGQGFTWTKKTVELFTPPERDRTGRILIGIGAIYKAEGKYRRTIWADAIDVPGGGFRSPHEVLGFDPEHEWAIGYAT